MATRTPFSWLVVDTVDDRNGCPTVLFATAKYDVQGDLLEVTGPGGQYDVAQVSGHPKQALAKHLLRQMFKREQDEAA